MYVCLCKAVTDTQIKQAIRAGCTSVRMVGGFCHAGMDCGSCGPEIRAIVDDQRKEEKEENAERPFRVINGGAGGKAG